MGIIDVFLIGVGLSMDAFAVAICKGLKMKSVDIKQCIVTAAFFGVFQAVMPTIGWLVGKSFQHYIEAFDHWIAFLLLLLIGGNMIREAITEKSEEDKKEDASDMNIKELFLLAIATSIDALAVGIAFASLGDGLRMSILQAVILIGITTFIISIIGFIIGNIFGAKYKTKAEIAGGAILILIGVKILLEHLGII